MCRFEVQAFVKIHGFLPRRSHSGLLVYCFVSISYFISLLQICICKHVLVK